MTTNVKVKQEIQKLLPDDVIELYSIDLNPIGVDYRRDFTKGPIEGEFVTFGGVIYLPFPVEVEGFELDGSGKLPRPTIRVANVNLTFVNIINANNDCIGASLTRRRTFKKYLDGQSEPDNSAQFADDIYYINRKKNQNKYFIEWELVSSFDIEHKMIPKGQVLESCTHRYGIGGSMTTCPYAGAEGYFEDDGSPTGVAADDKCGKRLNDCKLRYPQVGNGNNKPPLPYQGFPNIGHFGTTYRRF